MTDLPNTGVGYFAYGIHQANRSDMLCELLNDIQSNGTNVSREGWEAGIKGNLRHNLKGFDPATITGEDGPEPDFFEHIAAALCSVDVISSIRCLSAAEKEKVEAIMELHDCDKGFDEGFDFEAIFDQVFDWLNEYYCGGGEDTYVYRDDEADVELMASTLGGAYLIWVTKSPFVTPCAGCSPCVPGAGDLDSPCEAFPVADVRPGAWDPANGKWAFCLPPKWFEEADEPAPYTVVRRRGEGYLGLLPEDA